MANNDGTMTDGGRRGGVTSPAALLAAGHVVVVVAHSRGRRNDEETPSLPAKARTTIATTRSLGQDILGRWADCELRGRLCLLVVGSCICTTPIVR
jgi:hypothetical protein